MGACHVAYSLMRMLIYLFWGCMLRGGQLDVLEGLQQFGLQEDNCSDVSGLQQFGPRTAIGGIFNSYPDHDSFSRVSRDSLIEIKCNVGSRYTITISLDGSIHIMPAVLCCLLLVI